MKRTLWLVVLASLAGCNASSSMKVQAPAYPGAKAPYSVAFSPAGGPEGHKLVNHCTDSGGWMTVHDRGSIDAAFRTILESQFERVLPPGVAGADFMADARLEGLDERSQKDPTLDLTLTHVASGDVVFGVRKEIKGPNRWPNKVGVGPIHYIAIIPPLYFLIPVFSKRCAMLHADHLEKGFEGRLEELSRRLAAAIPGIRDYLALLAKVRTTAEAADAAASAGRHQDAFEKYLEVARMLPAGHKRVAEFHAKLLPLVPKVDPPELPEEARKEFYAGVGKSQAAKTQWEGAAAAKMLEKAVELAPWWPEAHYNLAVAYEIAQEYRKAAAAFGNFLVVKPDAKEAEETRKRMYALEGRGR